MIILFVGKNSFFFFQYKKIDSFFCIKRSLAIDLRNARERLEAYKFLRRFLQLYPLKIPHSFIYILDSIVSSSYLTRSTNLNDQMVNCCLELLCEIGKTTKELLYIFISFK